MTLHCCYLRVQLGLVWCDSQRVPRRKTLPLISKILQVFFCSIAAGNLLCWTHPLPGNLSSGNTYPERAVTLHANCTHNLRRQLVCRLSVCPSCLWGIRPRAQKQLRFRAVHLRTNIGSVLVLFMKVRNTTAMWKGKQKRILGNRGAKFISLHEQSQFWLFSLGHKSAHIRSLTCIS